MPSTYSYTEFYNELELALPQSNAAKRAIWATTIIEKDIAIKDLSKLLLGKKEVALRFAWLLSEMGEINPQKLFRELPFLLELSDQVNNINFKQSFANYWRIAGVPLEDEGRAIDLLFGWLQSPTTNVTIKSRSLFVLFSLTKKYPELKNELKVCIEDQLDKYTEDFDKRARKILEKIEQ